MAKFGPEAKPTSQPKLRAAIAAAEERREAVMAQLSARQTILPLRYWRQQAHYTVPADKADMARKALSSGTTPMARLMERFGISADDLAAKLELEASTVEELLARPRPAPVVVLDAEDARAPGAAAAAAALRNVVALLSEPPGPLAGVPPLRFFRPPRVRDPAGAGMLLRLLWALADGDSLADRLPLDGIVVPKVDHPEEIELLDRLLNDAEADLGLPGGSLRLALLVESGWAVAQLPELARRAAPRLCALIYGPVDHAADIGLPAISATHPVALAARASIVGVAGAVGVPAIDGMTLAYPVADPAIERPANHELFLERVALAYRDAREGRALGMLGKWVGHPAQLFAALLAFEQEFVAERLASDGTRLEASLRAAADGRGATIIETGMNDRATERHVRAVLRQAVAVGRFDPDRALELGVLEPFELDEARMLHAASSRSSDDAPSSGVGASHGAG